MCSSNTGFPKYKELYKETNLKFQPLNIFKNKEGMNQKYKKLFCFSTALVNKKLMCLQKKKKLDSKVCVCFELK